ncbi:MAG: mevalonate kinase [Candidatus Hermodarchaeota archaeon]
MRIVRASAPGKCILFGEHAVVYGYPAIAAAISLKSTCIIEELSESKIELILKNFNQSYKFEDLNDLFKKIPPQLEQIKYLFKIINQQYNTQIEKVKITIFSNLFPSSGLGSSASIAVALVMAFNTYLNLKLEKTEISKIAFEMERIIHGTPSGIDNTICTFGKLIFFQGHKFRYLEAPQDFDILVTYSNMDHDTKLAIDQLRGLKNEEPLFCDFIFDKIRFYTELAELEINQGNLNEIGKLMNINQKLLASLNLSNDSITEIVNVANENGAYGSKLTGAGLGGCVITIGNDDILEEISQILNKKGYKSLIANIDKEGAIIEKH